MFKLIKQIKKILYSLHFAHEISSKKQIHVLLKCTVLHATEKGSTFI